MTGGDLWPAIEAAQYARVVLCVRPQSEPERTAMADFVEGFTRFVETWEGLPPSGQATALESLGRKIDRLGERDLHVHWGVTERTFDASGGDDDRIPLAVVVVDGTKAPTATITVPLDLEVEVEPDDTGDDPDGEDDDEDDDDDDDDE